MECITCTAAPERHLLVVVQSGTPGPLYQNTAPQTPHRPTSFSGNRTQCKHPLIFAKADFSRKHKEGRPTLICNSSKRAMKQANRVTVVSVQLSGTHGEQELQGMLLILPRHVSHPISEHTRSVCAALCRRRIHQPCILTHFIHSYYLYYRFTHTLLIALRNRTYSSSWHESQRKEGGKKSSLAVTNVTCVESNSICGRS